MIKIEQLRYEDLTPEQQSEASNNGSGKEFAGYLKVTFGDQILGLFSDAMEPEDACFFRDLSWVTEIIEKSCKLSQDAGYKKGFKQGFDQGYDEGYDDAYDQYYEDR